ncbi:hypothetical protein P691DRAFT_715470, partial [Macrolepiota fuliginosa MF-IS2]
SPEKPIHVDITWPASGPSGSVLRDLVDTFFLLCQWDGHPLNSLTSEALLSVQVHVLASLSYAGALALLELDPPSLRKNIHPDFRDRIVRRTCNPVAYLHIPRNALWKDVYVVGCGE